MKILVAGGTGFLGSNLCGRLLDRGDTVYCLDNLSTSSIDNVAELYASNRFHLILANIVDGVPDLDVDQIYNLASPTAPGHYKKDPEGTRKANIAGTENLLKLATEKKAVMLFTSSCRVLEDTPADSPHACYTESKLRGEGLCLEYFHTRGTNVKIARLFNVYGPKMALDDSRVVPQFVRNALTDEPLTIVGSGEQRDSFCYVDDILEGLAAYMDSDIKPGPLAFGYPETISIYDLARLTINTLGSLSVVKLPPDNWIREFPMMYWRGEERADRIPDIAEAQRMLGWEPKVHLDAGLMRLADYYSARM